MKSSSALVFAALLTPLASPLAAQKKPLSLEQAIGAGPRVQYYTSAQRIRWAPDGQHYVMRRDGKTVWVHPATGAVTEPPKDTEEDDDRGGRGGRGGFSPRASALHISEKELDRLVGDDEPKRIPTSSPDEKWVSWVRDGNLSIVEVATKKQWPVTTKGSDQMLFGVLDWVYQEEIYGRGNFRGHWWSGDSRAVAFLGLDQSAVKDFTIIDHVPNDALEKERAVLPEVMKYPKAGDPNPRVSLHVTHPREQRVVDVDLGKYDAEVLIVRVGWTPDDSKLLFAVQDRIQTWYELNTADPETGEIETILRETSKTWVSRLPLPDYQDDGSFLWQSERTGYRHLYHYDADGTLRRAVTSGEWQVGRIARVGDFEGRIHLWFTGTADGATDDNLYRVALDGGEVTRLTNGEGRHSTSLNGDASYFLDTVSTVSSPSEVRLCKGDGSGHEVLDRAQPKDVETHVLCPTERLTIQARDGYPLDATLIVPPDYDPQRRYPIYLPTYSGPNSPSVRNSFRPSSWQQFLAQRGMLILQVNVRSASGRGHVHTGMAYKQLGVVELRDLEDAVDWVCAVRGGDPDRVAIDGWSYGGFMAAFALTHSEKFTLGIAGGGVYDWQLYDTIYTERYMSTPQLNPEGYKATSVLEAAKDLHGHLVMLHGAMDDNVHAQNAMRLAHLLQQAGKDNFEMMLYPKSRHGVRGAHRLRVVWRAIRDKMGLSEQG